MVMVYLTEMRAPVIPMAMVSLMMKIQMPTMTVFLIAKRVMLIPTETVFQTIKIPIQIMTVFWMLTKD